MTAHRCLHVLKSHTEYKHTHKNRWITVSFVTPQGAILCTTEMWQIPSLINVETSPINIFISSCAPCWKHIQGDFKLYELISYLLRQLSMPTTSPSSPNLPFLPPLPLCSFPSCHFFFRFFTLQNGIWVFGVHTAGNEAWGLKVSVLFQSFSLGKVCANPLKAWSHTIW